MDISRSITAFTRLCTRYSNGWLCHGPWMPFTNLAWVMAMHRWHQNGFLKEYNLGKIGNEQFIEKFLSEICYFMNTYDFQPTREDKDRIDGTRNQWMTFKGKDTLTQHDYAVALIEEA